MTSDRKVIALLILLIVAVAGCGYLYANSEPVLKKKRKSEANAFIVSTIKAIASEWNPAELEKHAHPLLLEGVAKSGGSLENSFLILKQLGTLKQDGNCTFQQAAAVTTASDQFSAASYVCNFAFENDTASIALDIRQDNMSGPWKIVNFSVNSPLFVPKQDKQEK